MGYGKDNDLVDVNLEDDEVRKRNGQHSANHTIIPGCFQPRKAGGLFLDPQQSRFEDRKKTITKPELL